MGAWNPSEGLSVGALVFAGPTVNVCGLHRIPFSGALRVFDKRRGDVVLPLLIRNGEATHCRLSTVGRA